MTLTDLGNSSIALEMLLGIGRSYVSELHDMKVRSQRKGLSVRFSPFRDWESDFMLFQETDQHVDSWAIDTEMHIYEGRSHSTCLPSNYVTCAFGNIDPFLAHL